MESATRKKQNENQFEMLGYKITLCFSDKDNPAIIDEVKKLLINSYKTITVKSLGSQKGR